MADGTTLPAVPEDLTDPAAGRGRTDRSAADRPDDAQPASTPTSPGVVIIVFPNQEAVKGNGTKAMIAELRELVAAYQSAGHRQSS